MGDAWALELPRTGLAGQDRFSVRTQQVLIIHLVIREVERLCLFHK